MLVTQGTSSLTKPKVILESSNIHQEGISISKKVYKHEQDPYKYEAMQTF